MTKMPLTATQRFGVVALAAALLAVGLAPWGASRPAASAAPHGSIAGGASSPVGKCPLGYGADASAVPLSGAALQHQRPQHSWSTMATTPADRARAALLGAIVADAASTGVHWLYAQADVLALAQGRPKSAPPAGVDAHAHTMALMDEQKAAWAAGPKPAPLDLASLKPEFLDPPACPFYSYPVGEPSPYGFEALTLLRSLVKQGGFDAAAFAADSAEQLGAYGASGKRLNTLSKLFLAAYADGRRPPHCGARDDSQAHSLVRVPVLVARFGGGGGGGGGGGEAGAAALAAVSDAAIRVHQDNDLAASLGAAAAALLARAVATGDEAADVLRWALASDDAAASGVPASVLPAIAQALAASGLDPREVAAAHGLSCALPGAFVVALAIAASPLGYAHAARANMLAGGDSASRAALVGAFKAARAGRVPPDWLDRLLPATRDEVLPLVDALLLKRE